MTPSPKGSAALTDGETIAVSGMRRDGAFRFRCLGFNRGRQDGRDGRRNPPVRHRRLSWTLPCSLRKTSQGSHIDRDHTNLGKFFVGIFRSVSSPHRHAQRTIEDALLSASATQCCTSGLLAPGTSVLYSNKPKPSKKYRNCVTSESVSSKSRKRRSYERPPYATSSVPKFFPEYSTKPPVTTACMERGGAHRSHSKQSALYISIALLF